MKTEVIMKRVLFGDEISQKSKTEFFSATDMVKAGNKWRISNGLNPFDMSEWFRLKSTKEFIAELEKHYGKIKVSGRGRGKHTWVHPLLFLDMALSINPRLKIEVYEWLYDSLLKFRNESGDSYRKMCGSLYAHESNRDYFRRRISLLASKIQEICKVHNWQEATEVQLKLRDNIQHNILIISNVLRDNDKAIEYGIREALRDEK